MLEFEVPKKNENVRVRKKDKRIDNEWDDSERGYSVLFLTLSFFSIFIFLQFLSFSMVINHVKDYFK